MKSLWSKTSSLPKKESLKEDIRAKNVVIGAGSVVSNDIPSNSLAVGNPCRVIRPITEADRWRNHPEYYAD